MIVYMAHIGSYVPAEAAVVGLVDRIFTRISAQESCVWLGAVWQKRL